jgi:GT2 family glycosyltransferase
MATTGSRVAHSTHLRRPGAGQTLDRCDSPPPLLSVIVPAYGRSDSLVRCLEALCAQTLPRDRFEVIVCDDGSPEPLAPAVAPFGNRLALVLTRQPNAGPAAARNHGALRARGDLLAFTDDDCIPAPDWLERLVERFERNPEQMVGGAMENTLPNDPYATATHLLMSSVYEYYEQHSAGQRFFSTTNLAVPADRFWQIGGFSETFPNAAGEDYDFCARWHENGFSSSYASEVVVGHAHGHDLRSFWKQHFTYGRALLRVRQGMARRGGHAVRIEPARFYTQILTYPIRRGHGVRRWAEAALVLLSQVATVAGAARELVGRRHKELNHRPSTDQPSTAQ